MPPPVFQLRAWTIKQSGNRFHIIPSASFGMRWSKGYKSLQAACAAIARKHAEEWIARNARYARWRKSHASEKEPAR
jgi:hypothetical protein